MKFVKHEDKKYNIKDKDTNNIKLNHSQDKKIPTGQLFWI